jgi:hypothetical protein
MNVIEIFGQVTAYSFDKVSHKEYWWECLFPDEKFSELDVNIVRQKNQERLNDINPSYIFYP